MKYSADWFKLVPGLSLVALVAPAGMAQPNLEELDNFFYWRNLCDLQIQAGEYEDAQASCESALELEPEDADTWAVYSGVLLNLDQYPEAIATAEEAIFLNPQQSLALTYQCMAWFELGNTDQALDACNEALRVNGSWGRQSPILAWLYRGRLLAQQEDYDAAIVAYDRTLLLDPANAEVLTYQCESWLALKNYDQAIDQCQAALESDRQWGSLSPAVALYNQGLAYQAQGQPEQAISAFDRAIDIEPGANNPQIWTGLGESLVNLERPEEALSAFNRAVELAPESSRALVGQCDMLNQTGSYEAALAACDQAIAGDGRWGPEGAARAWSEKAQALAGQGDYPAALAAANRAVGLRPNYADAWNNRGVVLWYLEEYSEAIASLQRSAEIEPNSPLPYANLGRILRSLGQFEPALAAYDEALKLDASDSVIWANRSVVLWSLERYSEALDSANQSLNLNTNQYLGWFNRAAALAALDRSSEALTAYQQALRVNPESADAWTGLGVMLSRLSRYEEAQTALATALELDPQQPVAQAVLQRLPPTQPGAGASPR